MKKNLILIAAAAFLCAGCEQIIDKEAAKKKRADAEEAAAKASARFANRGKTVSTPEGVRAGGEPLVAILCASPRFVQDIEENLDLLEALSGPGSDPAEVNRQFLEIRERYRAHMKNVLPKRGSSYEEFSAYAKAMKPPNLAPEARKTLGALITEKCPKRNRARIERAAAGLMNYCEGPGR
ncbi:MAG TPA: hypothetical protein PKK31_04740 [Elusimicrobiales bacterium]|nr:hypothetical protein [Elusimicrobiales bacterium]